MDIEKLIEKLRTESLYKDKATLEIMDLCMEAADKLERINDFDKSQSAKLLAENGKLRVKLEEANNRLADYEDTGLKPGEIKSLQGEWSVNLKALEMYRDYFSDPQGGRGGTEKGGAVKGERVMRMDKQKGWPPCARCDQWRPISCECKAINEQGVAPCQVMSRKLFNHLAEENEDG